MLNKHNFQQSAKAFRAGRLTLKEFTDAVFSDERIETGTTDPAVTHEDSAADSIRTLPQLPRRLPESHKGDFGRVVLIGGSRGMSGAISLTGLAALRSGSGLVKIAVPDEIQATVAAFTPCYMTVGCKSNDEGEFHEAASEILQHRVQWSDVIGLGPGLGRGQSQMKLVPILYAQAPQPMVVDADGLNSLVDAEIDLKDHAGHRILTPHPGEFQRLVGSKATERMELEKLAIKLAGEADLIVVLKGHRTLVTDGRQHFHNQTGNPGMATAGAGDVLTGVITSLVGQGMSVFDAAVLGVHLHGLAGDLMAQKTGQASLIATDLIDGLPLAFRQFSE